MVQLRASGGRIGASAPSIQMLRRTLKRLAAGEDVSTYRGGIGRPCTLKDADGLYIDLLLCDGLSQRHVTLMLNAEQRVQGHEKQA